jgi:hypothetical protein
MKAVLAVLIVAAIVLSILAFRSKATIQVDSHEVTVAVGGSRTGVVSHARESSEFPIRQYTRVALVVDAAAILFLVWALRRTSRTPPRIS